jgi:hypothetical protein
MTTKARVARYPIVALIGGAVLLTQLANGDPPPNGSGCRVRIDVQISPEVPNPRSTAFLSSLLAWPGYTLTWIGTSPEDMGSILELTGPGPSESCREEVKRISDDARILELKVLPDSDE